MVRPLAAALLLVGMAVGLTGAAQTSHRQPNPTMGSPPKPFDQLFEQAEKEAKTSQQEAGMQQAAAREQRKAEVAKLARELPQLISLAQGLQERLNSADLNTTLPADLRQQSERLEQLARQIRKRVRGL